MSGRFVATFSIVAADVAAGDLGIAVASKFLAAGAVVPWASAGAGAVATQSWSNTSYGPQGIAMMRAGASAKETLAKLIAADDGRDKRQVGIADARGGSAAHTGVACHGWAGHVVGEGFAAQGNLLVGKDTVDAMAASFRATRGALSGRLLAALKAGEAAGGDRRGRQSAALMVVRDKGGYLGMNDVLVDLRVDDAPDPVGELARLMVLQQLYFGSTPMSEKLKLEGALQAEIAAIVERSGHGKALDGGRIPFEAAFEALIAAENLEERIDPKAGLIDPPALAYLRERFG